MLLNELQDTWLSHSTKAYGLGGMQAICKHIGLLKRTVLQGERQHFGGNSAW
jgi:hypothetical protein